MKSWFPAGTKIKLLFPDDITGRVICFYRKWSPTMENAKEKETSSEKKQTENKYL